MKRWSMLLLLLFVTVSVILACQSGHETDGETAPSTTDPAITEDDATTEVVTTEAPETEPPVGTPVGWFEHGNELVLRDKFTPKEQDAVSFSMAKNEIEAFQYIVTAEGGNLTDLRCEVSTLSDGNGNTLDGTVYLAWDLYVEGLFDGNYSYGFTPNALLEQDNPYQGGTFDVVGGRAKTLYVKYKTDRNTVPGLYTGTLEIKQGDTVLLSGHISLTVWDIYYDEKTELITLFQYGYYRTNYQDPAPDSAPDFRNNPEYYETYADFLLENRISPWFLPDQKELLGENPGKYMNNPRQTMVILKQGVYAAQYEVAAANGWADKCAFLFYDEPTTESHLSIAVGEADRLQSKFPSRKIVTPLHADWLYVNGKNAIEYLSVGSTLHCVKTAIYHDAIRETCERLRDERGDTLLWYTCGDQPEGTIDLLTYVPGNHMRILFWQHYLYDIDGFLYYHTCEWHGLDDFWAPDYAERTDFRHWGYPPTGMGYSIFWDPLTGAPVSSLIIEATRDGIEDFQLMKMAEEVLGKDTVMEYVKRITTALDVFEKDAAVLEQVKTELALALLAASGQ